MEALKASIYFFGWKVNVETWLVLSSPHCSESQGMCGSSLEEPDLLVVVVLWPEEVLL